MAGQDRVKLAGGMLKKIGMVSINPGIVNAGTTVDATVAMNGLRSNDVVLLIATDAAQDGALQVTGTHYLANNQLRVRFRNNSGLAVAAAARSYSYLLFSN